MKKLFFLAISFIIIMQLPAQRRIDQLAGTVAEYASTLTLDKLKKATCITYYSGNGSVAPDYHYDCCIIVTPNEVNVKIYHGYDGTTVYDESSDLLATDYTKFIKHLANQKIRKIVPEWPMLDGAGTSMLEVKIGNKEIFSGDEQYDVSVGNGNLIDAFLPLLPDEMRQAALDPESYINTL